MKLKFLKVTAVITSLMMLVLAGCYDKGNENTTETDTYAVEITTENKMSVKGDENTTTETDTDTYTVEVPFNNRVSVFSFDENGKLLSQTNPGSNTDTALIEYEYDNKGNNIKTTHYDSDNTVCGEITYTYDESGKCIKEVVVSDISSFTKTYEYDTQGNISKITGDDGVVEIYAYNSNGLCVSEDTYSGEELVAQATFSYSDSNKLIKAESTKGNCEYEYDSSDRLVKETYDWYFIEYEYIDDNTAKVYTTYEGQPKSAVQIIEFFDNKNIVKNSWYEAGTENGFGEINIYLVEDYTAHEPDPTLSVLYK